ncbi:uncharacterized protein SPSK_00343 [Sporothrix schenckii 1099-18]|uniref:Uncharacterized protein n=1 Tax=Sporothrix schenckii 1099-18 TaxID=1397361 RepID=A0A0F2M744_SPOSC|nr:uncharacterized protein SPSK_00343 [Sporothrix schenckii 1099-18]KJR83981.1 hypothetical protein SPSK_00343 [Sporothrix schenckii 1099-18]
MILRLVDDLFEKGSLMRSPCKKRSEQVVRRDTKRTITSGPGGEWKVGNGAVVWQWIVTARDAAQTGIGACGQLAFCVPRAKSDRCESGWPIRDSKAALAEANLENCQDHGGPDRNGDRPPWNSGHSVTKKVKVDSSGDGKAT